MVHPKSNSSSYFSPSFGGLWSICSHLSSVPILWDFFLSSSLPSFENSVSEERDIFSKPPGEAEAPPHPVVSLKVEDLSHSLVGTIAHSETFWGSSIPTCAVLSLERPSSSAGCVGPCFGSSLNLDGDVCEGLLKVWGWIIGRGFGT